ncbi:MAG: NAD(P)/FAD-dependent oxidoreductase [Endomicrobium sp.]|jgi:dihydrolipoamide dehydrogenase|nr:NAD(P)/FAD-dependent oxidoreductase [Endomicrobium sp.]
MKNKYDIAVIGSGPAGFNAAVRAARLGASAAIIEKSDTGGTCLNRGCVPTKFFWQALKTKQKIQKSYEYGFKAVLQSFSFADIAAKKDKTVSNIRKGMELILSSYSIDIIKGEACFKDKNALVCGGAEIAADKIVIACGTRPAQIKNFAFDGVKIINSDDFLNLKEIPKSVLIVGGGVIGVEAAALLAGFGSRVAIAECESSILSGSDAEFSAEITKNLQRHGVEIFTSCLNALDDAEKYDKVLIAAGRTPCGGLFLEKAGVETDAKGFIKTDEFCMTNVENIYAAGDIAGKNFLAFTAQNEGATAAENAILGNKIKLNNEIIPSVIFSTPQAALVKVKDYSNYKNVVFGKFPYTASARAFIENERSGFIKCAADKDSGKPLGFWIVGANADEIINAAAQILKSGAGLSRETFFHPSLSEGLFNAYEDAFGKCAEKAFSKREN